MVWGGLLWGDVDLEGLWWEDFLESEGEDGVVRAVAHAVFVPLEFDGEEGGCFEGLTEVTGEVGVVG